VSHAHPLHRVDFNGSTMATWQVRQEGSPNAITVSSEADVLTGLRDGIWLPTDEVRGPGETQWRAIETHPAFAEAADELGPPPPLPPDETHLDMNPLIDVCLVLLIFFILTITYESLRRAIDLPQDTTEEKGAARKLEYEDIKDKVIRVTARMDGEAPVVKIEDKAVPIEQFHYELRQTIDRTGRKEMLLDVDGNVPWGVQTQILDAAKGNAIHNILYRPKPRR
jgi:biopolymer transport protein ExbD